MADLSTLGNLNSAEPLDLEMYPDAQEFKLPKAGRYSVRAPESFPSTAFGASQAGFLTAQVDPTIIGPTNEGFTLRFTKVSAKPWKDKNGLTISQLGRYLRAAGRKDVVSGDPQAQADAVEQTANSIYQIDADWEARCNPSKGGCGFKLEGMTKFPSDGNGGYTHFVPCPNGCKDPESGEPTTLRGNLVVKRFLASK